MEMKPLTENYWRESVANYQRSWMGMSIPEMHQSNVAYEAIREFACDVLVHLAASNGIKKFSPKQIMGHKQHPGISILIDDGDILRHLRFGIYMNEWSIETYLPHPESLPYMADNFWSDIAALSTLGEVELFESSPVNVPPGIPKRFKNVKKSVIFQLVRNILFRMQCDPQNSHDVGVLITKWSIETPFVELMNSLRAVYGIYYRCVRQLMRDRAKKKM